MINAKLTFTQLMVLTLLGSQVETCSNITNFPISTRNKNGYLADDLPGTKLVCCWCPSGTSMSKKCHKGDITSRLCTRCLFVDGDPSQQYFRDENPHAYQTCKLSVQDCSPGFIRQQGNRTHDAICENITTTVKVSPTTTAVESPTESVTSGLNHGMVAGIVATIVFVVVAVIIVGFVYPKYFRDKSLNEDVERNCTEYEPVANPLENEELTETDPLHEPSDNQNTPMATGTNDSQTDTRNGTEYEPVTNPLENEELTETDTLQEPSDNQNTPMATGTNDSQTDTSSTSTTTEDDSENAIVSDTRINNISDEIPPRANAKPVTNYPAIQQSTETDQLFQEQSSNDVTRRKNGTNDLQTDSRTVELSGDKTSGNDQVPSYKSVNVDTHKKIMFGIRDKLRSHIQKKHLADVLRYLGFLRSDIDDLNEDHDNSTRGFTVRAFDLMITRGQDDVNPTKLVEAFKNAQNKGCADAIKEYCRVEKIECCDNTE